MSYLHSILLAKPSLHLQVLRASGLQLDSAFETTAAPLAHSIETGNEAEEIIRQAASSLKAGLALGKLQFNELCLNDE